MGNVANFLVFNIDFPWNMDFKMERIKGYFFEGMVEVGDMSTGLGEMSTSKNNNPIELKDLESQT